MNQPTQKKYQPGGVAITTTFEVTTRYAGTSQDPTGLGRWTSVLINGRQGHSFRVVCAYNPCKSTLLNSVYQQHVRWLDKENRSDDPHTALEKDLRQALLSWLDDGEEIAVCMDLNQDIRRGPLQKMFHFLGLKEMVMNRHQASSSPPATYSRNESDKPIDGIFCTMDDPSIRCSWSVFDGDFPGDHRTVMVDIPFQTAFGHNPPHLHTLLTPRLVVGDPRIRRRYNRAVIKGFKEFGVIDKSALLRRLVASDAPLQDVIDLHDEVYQLSFQVRQRVVATLQKKRLESALVPTLPTLAGWAPALDCHSQEDWETQDEQTIPQTPDEEGGQ